MLWVCFAFEGIEKPVSVDMIVADPKNCIV